MRSTRRNPPCLASIIIHVRPSETANQCLRHTPPGAGGLSGTASHGINLAQHPSSLCSAEPPIILLGFRKFGVYFRQSPLLQELIYSTPRSQSMDVQENGKSTAQHVTWRSSCKNRSPIS